MNFLSRVFAAVIGRLGDWLPDDIYLKIRYRLIMGRKLDLNNPKSFNEKLNWLKIYYRDERYTGFADKATVKDYVAKQIGSEYVIPTYGVWDSFDEIDFDQLPNAFILKSTNGGGGTGVVVCRDKKSFDKNHAKRLLESSMSSVDKIQREWVYYDIKPRIIAEKLMKNDDGSEIVDYKIMCFNGVPDNIMVCTGRMDGNLRYYFFDRDWHFLKYQYVDQDLPDDFTLPKPEHLEEMFALAEKLSKGLPFVRVDLYDAEGRVWFGELTFYPCAGFDTDITPETDRLLGDKLDLSHVTD